MGRIPDWTPQTYDPQDVMVGGALASKTQPMLPKSKAPPSSQPAALAPGIWYNVSKET